MGFAMCFMSHASKISFSFLAITLAAVSVQADSSEPVLEATSETTSELNTFDGIKSKTRIRWWSEYMTPTFANIPHSSAESEDYYQFPPSYAIAWADFEIGKDTKLLYWQRAFVFVNNPNGFQGVDVTPRNPRFALRKTNVIPVQNLSTTFDFYVQLGLGKEANRAGRNFEVGFRTSSSYAFPKSNWSVGLTTEVTGAYSKFDDGRGADLYGWVGPWASYEISETFSTIHAWLYNFQHVRGQPIGLQIDTPMPYMQNGFNVSVNKDATVSFLINHYTQELFAWRATSGSVWLSYNLL